MPRFESLKINHKSQSHFRSRSRCRGRITSHRGDAVDIGVHLKLCMHIDFLTRCRRRSRSRCCCRTCVKWSSILRAYWQSRSHFSFRVLLASHVISGTNDNGVVECELSAHQRPNKRWAKHTHYTKNNSNISRTYKPQNRLTGEDHLCVCVIFLVTLQRCQREVEVMTVEDDVEWESRKF